MSENENEACGCGGDCGDCGDEGCSGCSGCSHEAQDLRAAPHRLSNIKKVIGVVSGKGGVGKSLVTSMCAVLLNRKGFKTAVLDGDLTGPSIPHTFGIHERAQADSEGILPIITNTGISLMSINFFLEEETDPVVWRGAVVSNTVKQFWTDVVWGDIDYMFVDMPPGTGDVPLTIFQSLPVDGIIIVTSPQELVSMIVAKAVNMAKLMNIPILGIVENMSYFKCSSCGEKHYIYGKSGLDEIAANYGLKVLARLPIKPELANAVDKGQIENLDFEEAKELADYLETI
jgi:Mrp family chromosome partitioning ATPase